MHGECDAPAFTYTRGTRIVVPVRQAPSYRKTLLIDSPFPEAALMTSWLITPPSTADTGENSARLTRARCRIASADKKSAGSPLRANSSLAS